HLSPPRSSSLFPCTALFRSRRVAAANRQPKQTRPMRRGGGTEFASFAVRRKRGKTCESGTQSSDEVKRGRDHSQQGAARTDGVEDRKSTRLNSSYVKISYAV